MNDACSPGEIKTRENERLPGRVLEGLTDLAQDLDADDLRDLGLHAGLEHLAARMQR